MDDVVDELRAIRSVLEEIRADLRAGQVRRPG
jgi:hypothetical protein